jgi:hypothetical protein
MKRKTLKNRGYYTLRNGTEIQITSHRIIKNEDRYTIRYPDKMMSGDSYEVEERELRRLTVSKKYK